MCRQAGFDSATGSQYIPTTHLITLPASYPISIQGMSCECDACSSHGTSGCGHSQGYLHLLQLNMFTQNLNYIELVLN